MDDGPADPASPRILIVDDDARIRSLVAEVLRGESFEVVEGHGGDHALRLLASESFDAAVLDWEMPGIDGIEVLHWVRRTPATALLPVVLLTGHTEPHELVEGLGLGADDYVTKPFEPSELVARLRSLLRARASWTEVLAREVERRETLVETIRSAGSVGPLDQAAMQLCEGLVQLEGASGAAVVEVINGAFAPLASKGLDAARLLLEGSDRTASEIVRRAEGGPRLEAAVEPTTSLQTAVAVAPVIVDGVVVALVLASAEPSVSRTTRDLLLGGTIDVAILAEGLLGRELRETARHQGVRQRYEQLIATHSYATVFQPIVDLGTGDVVGYEALTRFEDDDAEDVFAGAARAGVGHELELHTIDAALEVARELPEGRWLAINVSPSLVLRGDELRERLDPVHGQQVVLELSELERVDDDEALRAAIDSLRALVRWSIDDTGSGFASLSRVLALRAEFIKVDRSWVRGIGDDAAKRGLLAGIQSFASESGSTVIAEGIETEAELETVRRLGIRLGQGYLLGTPAAP